MDPLSTAVGALSAVTITAVTALVKKAASGSNRPLHDQLLSSIMSKPEPRASDQVIAAVADRVEHLSPLITELAEVKTLAKNTFDRLESLASMTHSQASYVMVMKADLEGDLRALQKTLDSVEKMFHEAK